MSQTSDIRTMLRRDLRDEDSNDYRWTDNVLDRHITQAVREYSEALPRKLATTTATSNGSREISLSSLLSPTGLGLEVEAVEFPTGEFPPRLQPFAVWGATLTLTEAVGDGANCKLYYRALHDISSTWTVPTEHEELIVIGAGALALLDAAAQVNREASVGGQATTEAYRRLGEERLRRFRAELARVRGRRLRRVRLHQGGPLDLDKFTAVEFPQA